MPAATEKHTYLLAVIDPEETVTEAVKSNNILHAAVSIKAGGPPLLQNLGSYECPDMISIDAHLFNSPSIGWWNLLHLGYESGKDFRALGCIAAHFDVLAVSELENLKGLEDLRDAAAQVTGDEWGHLISPWEVGTATGKEYYGFIYRKSTATLLNEGRFFNDTDDVIKKRTIRRPFSRSKL